MILIIGSLASGKTRYVKTLGYLDSDIADGVLDGRPVLNNLQDLVFADPSGADRLFSLLANKEIVICDEVGSGVIPVEPGIREAREAVGRLCIQLASEAERVIRLVCGIPMLIKG